MKRNNTLWGYLFLTPQLLGLLAFALIPLGFALVLSFTNWDGFGAKTFIGLENFIGQFNNPVFWKALWNTVLYTILYIPIGISLSLLLAIALNKIKGKEFYRVLFFMPVVTSSVSVGVIWMWILNGDFGILNQFLANFGINGPQWLTDTSLVMVSIALVSVWWQLGFNMVIFLAGLRGFLPVIMRPLKLMELQSFRNSNILLCHSFHQLPSSLRLWQLSVHSRCLIRPWLLRVAGRQKRATRLYSTFMKRLL